MKYTEKEQNFLREVSAVINRYSFENRSNTPDFILAEYLLHSLKAFEESCNHRETWYGRKAEFLVKEPTSPDDPCIFPPDLQTLYIR